MNRANEAVLFSCSSGFHPLIPVDAVSAFVATTATL
jgi:hypothetical protein